MKTVLTKKEPEKKLLRSLKEKAGRARSGRITMRHQGGGVKRLYRVVDFGQEKINTPAKAIALEYDPYRTAFIVLLEYEGGVKRYRIAPQGLKTGDKVICAEEAEVRLGNRMQLKNIPVGTIVYNIEIMPGKGGKMVRSAGSGARILSTEGGFTNLEMPSKEVRKIPETCFASIGQVSHAEHRYQRKRKAGSVRLKGIRPRVRGTAMNPVDHPHGGGEGRSGIGMKHPKTPWGKPALGVKTRKRKKTDKFILRRRKKKRR